MPCWTVSQHGIGQRNVLTARAKSTLPPYIGVDRGRFHTCQFGHLSHRQHRHPVIWPSQYNEPVAKQAPRVVSTHVLTIIPPTAFTLKLPLRPVTT